MIATVTWFSHGQTDNTPSVNVFIADYNTVAAEAFTHELNQAGKANAASAHVDVSDWNQLVKAFDQAIAAFGKIDYVYPIAGIGERKWMTNNPNSHGWEAPDLSVSCLQNELFNS